MNTLSHQNISLDTESPDLIDHVLHLIDSRLQFADHHTNSIIHSMLNGGAPGEKPDLPPAYLLGEELHPRLQSDSFLILIEEYSRYKQLLIQIRKVLTIENAGRAFQLIQKDVFLNFSAEELKDLLKIRLD